jgi:hypothetical protein
MRTIEQTIKAPFQWYSMFFGSFFFGGLFGIFYLKMVNKCGRFVGILG